MGAGLCRIVETQINGILLKEHPNEDFKPFRFKRVEKPECALCWKFLEDNAAPDFEPGFAPARKRARDDPTLANKPEQLMKAACGHKFHKRCLDAWLYTKANNSTRLMHPNRWCPHCAEPINPLLLKPYHL